MRSNSLIVYSTRSKKSTNSWEDWATQTNERRQWNAVGHELLAHTPASGDMSLVACWFFYRCGRKALFIWFFIIKKCSVCFFEYIFQNGLWRHLEFNAIPKYFTFTTVLTCSPALICMHVCFFIVRRKRDGERQRCEWTRAFLIVSLWTGYGLPSFLISE